MRVQVRVTFGVLALTLVDLHGDVGGAERAHVLTGEVALDLREERVGHAGEVRARQVVALERVRRWSIVACAHDAF